MQFAAITRLLSWPLLLCIKTTEFPIPGMDSDIMVMPNQQTCL